VHSSRKAECLLIEEALAATGHKVSEAGPASRCEARRWH
jgi:hypothetical protein